MAYGTPGVARRRRALLHRHPPRPAAQRRAAARPPAPLRRDRRHVAAGRAHRGAAGRAAGRARRAGAGPVHASCWARSTRHRSSRTRWPSWPAGACARSSGSSSLRTTRARASASTSAGWPRRPSPGRATAVPIDELAPAPRVHRLPGRAPSPRPGRRCPRPTRSSSPPTASPSGSSPATRTPTSSARAPRGRGRPPGSPGGPAGASPGRAPAPPPSRGAAPTCWRSSASSGTPAGPTAVLRVPAGLRLRPPRGALRPRHRGDAGGRGGGPRLRPHPCAQRRSRRARRARRPGAARLA